MTLIEDAWYTTVIELLLSIGDGYMQSLTEITYLPTNQGTMMGIFQIHSWFKFHNMTKELIIKASLYNMFVAMRM